MSNETWKEKMVADMARYEPFMGLRIDENCEHKVVIKRYEVIDDDNKVCKECGLEDPPKTEGQEVRWLCDCDEENFDDQGYCVLCKSPRGKRISALYRNGTRDYGFIEAYRELSAQALTRLERS